MKKVYLIACLLCGLQVASIARTASDTDGGSTSIKARATSMTRTLADKARLDEGQYLKVKQMNIRMLTETDDLKTRFAADQAVLDQHLADLQTKYDAEITELLRPAQLAVFQSVRGNMTALGTAGR